MPDVLGTIATEPGNLLPGSGAVLLPSDFASDFGPGPRRIWPEFRDKGPGIIAYCLTHVPKGL